MSRQFVILTGWFHQPAPFDDSAFALNGKSVSAFGCVPAQPDWTPPSVKVYVNVCIYSSRLSAHKRPALRYAFANLHRTVANAVVNGIIAINKAE